MAAPRRFPPKPLVSLKTIENEIVNRAVRVAVIEALRPIVQNNPARTIKSLLPEDCDKIGWGVIEAYQKTCKSQELDDEIPF